MAETYTALFDSQIKALFKDALKINLRDPGKTLFFWRTLNSQRKAVKTREEWAKKDVHVPPLMIISVTDQCNLNCVGCYAKALRKSPDAEMSTGLLRRIVSEAAELGVSIIMLAGGEPLLRADLLDIARDFPQVIFPVFTNGLLLDDEMLERIRALHNVIPVISLEGHEEATDTRRGQGIFDYVENLIERINSKEIFTGISFTVTRFNLPIVTDRRFVSSLISRGSKLFFFVEYVPVKEGTDGWILSQDQRSRLLTSLDALRTTLPGLFICFPGDEEQFGGCLSSGRGFVHVSAEGKLEPCPFAPFSDTSLKDIPLKEALKSEFLAKIRANHDELKETSGGCALWAKREWVASLIPTKEN